MARGFSAGLPELPLQLQSSAASLSLVGEPGPPSTGPQLPSFGGFFGPSSPAPLTAPAPYALHLPVGAPSGAAAAALAALHPPLLGSAAGVTALHLLSAALAPSSRASYDCKWRLFQAFCERQSPPLLALPADPSTVLAFLGHLAQRGTVAASNVRPYLAAIGDRHLDLQLANPTLGRAISKVIDGWQRLQREAVVHAPRTFLPAEPILALLHVGLSLPDPDLLRACTCSVISFVCGIRALSAANILFEDVVLGPASLSVLLRHEKRGRTVERRQISLPLPWLGAIASLWQRWSLCRSTLFATTAPSIAARASSSSAWALPSSRLSATPASVNELLRHALDAVGYFVPEGFTWSFHSLRKGFATCSASIGVPDASIAAHGGWAVGSDALERNYIVRNVTPSVAAHLFFGWLRRDHFTAAPSGACWLAEASAAFALTPGVSAFRNAVLPSFGPTMASIPTSSSAAAFPASPAALLGGAPSAPALEGHLGPALGLAASPRSRPARGSRVSGVAPSPAPQGRPPARPRRHTLPPARFRLSP